MSCQLVDIACTEVKLSKAMEGCSPYLALLPRRRQVLSGVAGGRELPTRGRLVAASGGLKLLSLVGYRRRVGRRGRGERRRGGCRRRRDGRGRRRSVGICGDEWICVMGK